MNKEEMSQLVHLQKEVKMLENEKEKISQAIKNMGNTTIGAATGSNSEFPYQPKSFLFSGSQIKTIDKAEYFAKRQQLIELKKLISETEGKCFDEYNKLIREINSIPDSLTRQILTHRYVNGEPWNVVAMKIGGGNTADSVRMIAERYMKGTT